MASLSVKKNQNMIREHLLEGQVNDGLGHWQDPGKLIASGTHKHDSEIYCKNMQWHQHRNKTNRVNKNKKLNKKNWSETIAANHRIYPAFYQKISSYQP